MKPPSIRAIASELNSRARTHRIGKLQEIRAVLHRRRRAGQNIFSPRTIFNDDGAFHYGGRRELQFNIWLEDGKLRHGVAFCFQRNQNLQKPVDVLGPKVWRFNKFMRLHSYLYGDMRMWHYYKDEQPSSDRAPAPIKDGLVTDGAFVFLGKRQPIGRINYEVILDDFDRLLSLYEYVESDDMRSVSVPLQVEFRPGVSEKASSAIAVSVRKLRHIVLLQNKMQDSLCRRLVSQYGADNVRAEHPGVAGTRIDAVVHQGNEYWFYEIKTADSVCACLREGIGQLLEYAFWPGEKLKASRLIVVGKSAIGKDGEGYLRRLKERFSLPIEYEQVAV